MPCKSNTSQRFCGRLHFLKSVVEEEEVVFTRENRGGSAWSFEDKRFNKKMRCSARSHTAEAIADTVQFTMIEQIWHMRTTKIA